MKKQALSPTVALPGVGKDVRSLPQQMAGIVLLETAAAAEPAKPAQHAPSKAPEPPQLPVEVDADKGGAEWDEVNAEVALWNEYAEVESVTASVFDWKRWEAPGPLVVAPPAIPSAPSPPHSVEEW